LATDGKIFASLALHLVLIGLPAIAAALFAVRRRVENVPTIIAIALATSGIVAFCSFGAYYAGSTVGESWDFFVLFGAVAVGVAAVWNGNLDRGVLRELRTPLALWVLGSFFIAYFGFIHGGFDQAVPMSSTRFSDQLPSDNDIPRFFAEWFSQHGHQNPPPIYPPDWLMSDRPPLQVGYVLSNQAVANSVGSAQYELIGIVVQQLWVPATWALLLAARLRPSTRALAMLAAMVSDVAILHGFFVWPKLIAATFVLIALALVISPEWTRWRRDWRYALLFGVLLALAMLSHGSSVFAVIPLVLVALLRGVPAWRWVAVMVLAGAVVYAPWIAYQKEANPPGNRLLKYQLGGAVEVENRGTLDAIADGYEDAGVGGTIDNKLENFEEMVGVDNVFDEAKVFPDGVVLAGSPTWADGVEALGEGDLSGAVGGFRGPRFTSLLPFLGILLIAPFAMFLARAKGRHEEAEWRFSLLCFAFVGVACLFWGLLLFGSPEARTTLHVGSLAVPLLALIACVVGLRSTYPRLAAVVVALNLAIVLATYTPALRPLPDTSYSALAALLAALSLAGIGWVLREAWRLPGGGTVR
jgi:hypothetical protein